MIWAMQNPPAIVQPATQTRNYPLAMALPTDASLWLNNSGGAAGIAKGKVTVLTFWTADCINCKRTLPIWNAWTSRFGVGRDVAVVSVHTPETKWERSPNVVQHAIHEHDLHFPVLIDNDAKVFNTFGAQAWPTTVVIDKQGRVRGKWEGELNWNSSHDYERVEQLIQKLRAEK